jgi:membrane protein YqaA with SNARE-associated domain
MKELVHQYGAWLVFALVFLESIGLPLPGEAILVSAAIFAGTTQDISIALVLLSAVLGAIFGSIIGFWIGDRHGYPLLLRYGSYIGLTETRIKIAQYPFRRQGMVVVLIARFVAVLRSVIGFIACQLHDCQRRGRDGLGVVLRAWRILSRQRCRGICTTLRNGVSRGRGHRSDLDDFLLAAQGRGARGCGRAGHSRTVAGRIVVIPRAAQRGRFSGGALSDS